MDSYIIDGTDNKNPFIYKITRNILNKPYPNFRKEFEEFKNLICESVKKNISLSFIHFGDGDYYFLKKEPVGSATPGKRALSKKYEDVDMDKFYKGFIRNDYICVEVLKHNLIDKYNELYPQKIISGLGMKKNYLGIKPIPTEFLYGVVSNKWVLRKFKNQIGLIGADAKLDLIKKMMTYKEYRDYLGCDYFCDYVKIPQKFACDNLDSLCKSVEKQLKESKSKIFLVKGIGHVKSGLYHKLKDYKKAIYLDVGACIDALAGIIDYKRPYMGAWINYKIKDYDYNKIDFLQYESRYKNEKYL